MVSAAKNIRNKIIVVNIRQLQTTYTGVQSYIYNLTENLISAAKNTTFHLLVNNYQNDNSYIEKLVAHSNVKLINHHSSIPVLALNHILFDLVFVNKYIKDADLYFNPVNMVPLQKNNQVPHLMGVLDLCTFIVPQTTTITLKTYYDLFLKNSLKKTDHIITISHNTKDDLVKLFKLDSEKITPIHLGIDPVFVHTKTVAKEFTPLSKEFSITKKKYFITIATSPRKNVGNVLTGYQELIKKYPQVKLFVISSDQKIITEIKSQNLKTEPIISQRFLSTEEIKSLYSNSLGLIYCPLYEGFGLPILEAMICHCPVITTKNSSLPEIAQDAALYVKENSSKSLSQAMAKLFTDSKLSQQLIKKGYKNATHYTWEKTSQQLIETISDLV